MATRPSTKIFTYRGGPLLADWSHQARGVVQTTSRRGFGACSFRVPMRRRTSAFWYGRLIGAHCVRSVRGTIIWEGRIEDAKITRQGLEIVAFGYARAFSDILENRLWSSMSIGGWVPVTTDMLASRNADLYETDNTKRIYLGLQKGTVYRTVATGLDVGSQQFTLPLSSAGLQRFAGTYTVLLPVNWKFQIAAYNAGYTSAVPLLLLVATGAVQTATFNYITLAGRTDILVSIYNETGASVTYAGENGSSYAKITNIRLATSTSTTLTSDEVLKAALARVVALNPRQINSNTSRIGNPGVDLKNFASTFETADVLFDRLAGIGDTLGTRWDWAVWTDQLVEFKSRTPPPRTFSIRSTPDVQRTLENLYNQVLPTYQDVEGAAVQGTTLNNAPSQQSIGIVRQQVVEVGTTSAADAAIVAGTTLADSSELARADITIGEGELLLNGVPVPFWELRSGDAIASIEHPTSGNVALDSTRRFRVEATSIDEDARSLTISPEERESSVAVLLAQRDVQYVE